MAQREAEIEVGDVVNVPGDMYGTVKFIGSVKGKAGVFAGVELSKEFAPRGKNDGDADGVQYFRTSIPHSGIFLPVGRATKRGSVDTSSESFPHTPTDVPGDVLVKPAHTPPTPSIAKLSQSVGPGRAASPMFKPKSRPSLPRPESPSRRQQPISTPATARPSLGVSRPGVGASRYAPSPTPSKMAGSTLKPKRHSNTFAGDPGRKTPATGRPGSRAQIARSESAMGSHEVAARTSQHSSFTSGKTYGGRDSHDNDVISLRQKLEQRDRQLKEQAAQLAEMESSLAEVQSLVNVNRPPSSGKSNEDIGGADAAQLRALLREKNEKITMLTAEFDAHRADFRSTIDTLEMASTETERVYEKRVEELLQHVRELQDRSEDVNIVARQLKQLEELVQELEEGLEDARRGEAEARSEVEFLRGEVERGRSELRREREKAAAALKGATGAVVNGGGGGFEGTTKEVEQRDDEIRGLKAIIHSLSRDSMPAPAPVRPEMNGGGNRELASSSDDHNKNDNRLSQQLMEDRDRLEEEMLDLRGLVERKLHREGELEREIDRLRQSYHRPSHPVGNISKPERQSGSSERTVVVPPPDGPPRSVPLATMHESEHDQFSSSEDHADTDTDSALWCEICETGGHDILTCTNISGSGPRVSNPHAQTTGGDVDSTPTQHQQRTGRDVVVHGLSSMNRSEEDHHNSPLGHKTTSSLSNYTPPSAKSLLVPDHHRQEHNQLQPMPAIGPKAGIEEEGTMGMVPGKASGVVDPNRWCALCERDGHESVDCPFEEGL